MVRKNYEKTRKSIFIGMCFLLSGVLFAQEQLSFVVEKDSVAFSANGRKTIELYEGDRITMNRIEIDFGCIYYDSEEYHMLLCFPDPNSSTNIFFVPAKNLQPANTEDTFDKDIFIDYPSDRYDPEDLHLYFQLYIGDVNEMWVASYYCDVLAERDREKLLEIHPALNDYNFVAAGIWYNWYDYAGVDIQNGRAMFYNSAIKLGDETHFAVKNINKTTYGYIVDCIESIGDKRYGTTSFTNSVFWDKYIPGDTMTLYIHLDGEYMDIYVDGNEILLGTFVKVKREFIRQYQSLIKTNTCDLTNVQWPRRADGSMGPPKETPNITITPRPIEESFDTASATETQLSTQNSKKPNALPLWTWLAIAGGAVVAVGVAVFVVRRKK